MRNYLKMMLIAVIAIPMFLSLTSCSKDDNDEKKDVYFGSFELTYKALNDLLSVANIEISYYDENGVLRSEAMIQAEWKKKITYRKLPANTGFKVIHTIKKQLPQDKTKFNLGHQYDSNINLLKNDNEIVSFRAPSSTHNSQGIMLENLESALTTYNINEFYQITEKEVTPSK